MITLALLALFIAMCFSWVKQRKRHVLPLPPGPKPLPLVGNLFNVPRKREWETFTEWGEKYGGIVYINVLGRPMVILNTLQAASDLLDKRSAIYSDRPRFPLIDLIGQEWNLGFMTYGKPWQIRKSLVLSRYGKNSVQAYRPAQRDAIRTLLRNLLDDPDNFTEHLRLHSGQLIIDVTYGISVKSREHHLIQTAEELMNSITIGLSPIFWLTDSVSYLQRVPMWCGGVRILRWIQKWQECDKELLNKPLEMVKTAMSTGTAKPSYVSSLLEELRGEDTAEKEDLVRDTAALAYGAGADTALAASTIFFLAMFQYQDVQLKAQAEIDRVIGSDRLPDYNDQQDLPYINAVLKECLRWHAVVPQGIAHRLTVDDEYNGYHLPAGSMVIPNVWGMLHDSKLYNDSSRFYPDRFIKNGELDVAGRDPARGIFGFGRRICAGEHFAQETMFLLISQFLAVFSIKTVDGGPPPSVGLTSGGVSFPEPYQCLIVPRSERARELIESNSFHFENL